MKAWNELVMKAELSGKRTPSSRGRLEPANNSTNLALEGPMSALGQKQTFALHQPMSALPPKADMCSALADVCYEAVFMVYSRTPKLTQHTALRL